MPVAVLASGSQSVASQVAPGVLGFLVVAGMALALFLLLRSMNKQLHKVGADRRPFGPTPDEPPSSPENIPNDPRQDP